jgi:3-methyladenine DNA glycosylase Mpg
MTRPPLYVACAGASVPAAQIVQTTRVGLRDDKGAELALRFHIADSPYVSRR